jgi:hypothetical protein
VIIGLFSGWWTLAIIFGVLYGAAAIAGLFLVLVVGDASAGGRDVPGVWLAEIDVISGIEFAKYVAGRDAGFGIQTAVHGPTPNGP